MSLDEDRDRYGYSRPWPWAERQYLEDLETERFLARLDASEQRIADMFAREGVEYPWHIQHGIEDGRQDVERDG